MVEPVIGTDLSDGIETTCTALRLADGRILILDITTTIQGECRAHDTPPEGEKVNVDFLESQRSTHVPFGTNHEDGNCPDKSDD
ncbi:hypothetical protein [Maricaulis sp.]|uniref:hypothetical protein n=1 Tax=Maricaulis sp. TaxID=1486257 RepID=UPI003A951382